MILSDYYRRLSELLDKDGDGYFEAKCLIEDILGLEFSFDDRGLTDEETALISKAADKRLSGYPLQYILGRWDFYDLSFFVGEGVLIPRPETEMLVDFALSKFNLADSPVIFDLCSGTGCIGITLAKHLPNAKVYLIEKENEALSYIEKNIKKYELSNVKVINGDVFDFDFSLLPETVDIVLSNPPYVPEKEIDTLPLELSFEPRSALDGGEDGLDFYRCFADKWTGIIKDGYMAFECAEDQADGILEIFNGKYTDSEILKDLNNIDRIVAFRI
ncbi:MAG: peptide chain release factor N(5)-glutamine methyltransferase [Clostridiales bacterium]|nr:peptide chain release factor N(5)-glutamine methyltransferase [Clostridiales bacterium]